MARHLVENIVKRNPSTGEVEAFPAGTVPPDWVADLVAPDSHVWGPDVDGGGEVVTGDQLADTDEFMDAVPEAPAPSDDGTLGGGSTAEPPPRAGKGSGREAWAGYAAGLGVEVREEMGRDDIVAAVEAAGLPV